MHITEAHNEARSNGVLNARVKALAKAQASLPCVPCVEHSIGLVGRAPVSCAEGIACYEYDVLMVRVQYNM